MWYPLPGLLATVVVLWQPWRPRPPAPVGIPVAAGPAVVLVLLFGTCSFGTLDLMLFRDSSPVPSTAELFPLPAGLHGVPAAKPC